MGSVLNSRGTPESREVVNSRVSQGDITEAELGCCGGESYGPRIKQFAKFSSIWSCPLQQVQTAVKTGHIDCQCD